MSGIAALDSWRSNVSRQRIAYGLLAAFVATHIATVSGVWYKIIGLPDLSWPAFNGILLLGHQGVEASGTQQFWAGSIYHFLTGIATGSSSSSSSTPCSRSGTPFSATSARP